MFSPRWVEHYFDLCKVVSKMSKDPSTKVGSVIVRPNKTIASMGFNGFPAGFDDNEELYNNRELKYNRIIHAEMNAILNSAESLKGYALFVWPLPPCHRCMPHIVQSGIKAVYVPDVEPKENWKDSADFAEKMAQEAGLLWLRGNKDER